MVAVVVVLVDSLELELDEEYPDGDAGGGGGVLLLDDDLERVRSIVRKISSTLAVYGVGGRSLTGLKV
jgi:hypothetical protein